MLVESRYDVCSECRPITCIHCKKEVKRAVRNEDNGTLLCFDCLTDDKRQKEVHHIMKSQDKFWQEQLSRAIRGEEDLVEHRCQNPKCGKLFNPIHKGQTYCNSCVTKIRNCRQCGETFLPTHAYDYYCVECSHSCMSCGTKLTIKDDGTFCRTCNDVIAEGNCTNCGKKAREIDQHGWCENCCESLAAYRSPANENNCQCGLHSVRVPNRKCEQCRYSVGKTLCSGCGDNWITSSEFMCPECLLKKIEND